jgi:hypothetical protein
MFLERVSEKPLDKSATPTVFRVALAAQMAITSSDILRGGAFSSFSVAIKGLPLFDA